MSQPTASINETGLRPRRTRGADHVVSAMTTRPQPTKSAPAEAPPEPPSVRQRSKGDVHVGTMAGDVRPVPGSGTVKGDKAIADVMRDVLDRVRRSVRERNNRMRTAPQRPQR